MGVKPLFPGSTSPTFYLGATEDGLQIEIKLAEKMIIVPDLKTKLK